ncbi:endolytic transglycosylase MltG [Kineosporia sp. J2-2]|uniref:Endolytic murein transglycosylase n=1 Tax=Kineosporia corallincola TaxID=2835133 RepID=A0ABS5TD06_9ACTN|nr:endolytic transglycosylase MltG [Kineosporia corallincola]MBT0768957.1 endolytic transglycosylase MltG [Kineosporia corallincola]
MRKRKKSRRRRTATVLLVSLIIAAGGVYGAYLALSPVVAKLTEPKDYAGPGSGAVKVTVPDGASGRTIAQVLVENGVTKTASAFIDAANEDSRAAGIQPGTYTLKKQMSGAGALDLLADPDNRITRQVTIPEGMRVADALTRIADKLELKRADLAKAATSGDIGLPKAANGKLEGFLFPSTYSFEPDVTATQALSEMVEHGTKTYDELGIPASKLRETVIKASIVEAEAGNEKYMGKVSRVLSNRLKIDMKLQLDSTVSYATGKFNVTTTSADRQTDSPYNTYMYAGLPGGPISNPGKAALEAALKPTPGDWLFFVTVNPDTGETKFAKNAAEHETYVKEFQAWLQANPGN